jgi:hypothetical protein
MFKMKRKIEEITESNHPVKKAKIGFSSDEFELIYEAARELNVEALKILLESICIDVWKKDKYNFSALSQMALENNRQAMDLLISHGSNINYGARGAALAKNHVLSDRFIKEGANINEVACSAVEVEDIDYAESLENVNINYLVKGAGRAYKGCKLLILDSLEKIEASDADLYLIVGDDIYYQRPSDKEPLKLTVDIAQWKLVRDFASTRIASDEDLKVINLFTKHSPYMLAYAQKCIEKGASKFYHLQGLAQGGHLSPETLPNLVLNKGKIYSVLRFNWTEEQKLQQLLRSYETDNNTIAAAAVLYGNFDLAYQLLVQDKNIAAVIEAAGRAGRLTCLKKLLEENPTIDRNFAAIGLSKGGHFYAQEFLNEEKIDGDKMASAASSEGHFSLARRLMINEKSLIEGAAAGGHKWKIDCLVNLQPDDVNLHLCCIYAKNYHNKYAKELIERNPVDPRFKQSALFGAAQGSNADFYVELDHLPILHDHIIVEVAKNDDMPFVEFFIQKSFLKINAIAESNHPHKDQIINLISKGIQRLIQMIIDRKIIHRQLNTAYKKMAFLAFFSPNIIKTFVMERPALFSDDCLISNRFIKQNYQYQCIIENDEIFFAYPDKDPFHLPFKDESSRTLFIESFQLKETRLATESDLTLISTCTNHSFVKSIESQAIAIRELEDEGFNPHLARVMKMAVYEGMRFLLLKLMMNNEPKSDILWLPLDLWCLIFDKVIQKQWNFEDYESIAMHKMLELMKIQLDLSGCLKESSHRGHKFFGDIFYSKNRREMKKCISDEAIKVKNDSDSDSYRKLIDQWNFKMV